MKKTIFTMTLLLVAALAVAACTAGGTVAPTSPAGTETFSVPETGATPVSTAQTSAPTLESTGAATLAPTALATSAATSAATAEVTSAATGEATTVPTTEATAAVTTSPVGTPGTTEAAPAATQTSTSGGVVPGTPQAGVPLQFVRLSILLQSNLTTGDETGKVSGVVIAQPQPQAALATATPAAQVAVDAPYIRYVVIDTSSASGEMLLPWQMFAFDPVTTTGAGTSQTFTLNGAAALRASAPRVTLPGDTGVLANGFDSEVAGYWANQGFVVPVTGASDQDLGTQVLLRESINGTSIVDGSSNTLGQVADFLIDPATGKFAYAVFNGGQLFGNRLFLVPVENLNFKLDSASAAGLGSIQLNVTPDLLMNAPIITDLNQFLVDPNLAQQLNDFWKSLPESNK